MSETYVEYDDEPIQDVDDEFECHIDDEFECPECGEELGDEGECVNPQCPCFGEEPCLAMSDWEERQHERKQMGVGL